MSRNSGESRLDELFGAQRSVVVLAARDGGGEVDSGSVDRLEDAFEVRSSRHFLDEEGCEALRTKLLVYAEEVDLGATLRPARRSGLDLGREVETYTDRTRRSRGIPEMKATSLPVDATRIPTCQSGT